MVAVVEIANLQRPRKKITRIPCLVHGEHSGQPETRLLLFRKHARTREVKYLTHGFEVYADYAVCNLFIHVI